MATVTLRPNAVTSDSASWVNTGGAGSKHAALADNNDATYIKQSDFSGAVISLGLETFDFGGGAITSVTLRCRYSGDGGSESSDIVDYAQVLGAEVQVGDLTGTGAVATYEGTGRLTKPGGGAWTQSAIDNLEIRVAPFTQSDGANDMRVYALYADVTYTPAPSSQPHTAGGVVGVSLPSTGAVAFGCGDA